MSTSAIIASISLTLISFRDVGQVILLEFLQKAKPLKAISGFNFAVLGIHCVLRYKSMGACAWRTPVVVVNASPGTRMSASDHLHALPRRSIAVCFTPVSGIDSRSQALPGRADFVAKVVFHR